MSASHILKLFIVSFPAYIIVDFIWFGILMRETYKFYLNPIAQTGDGTLQTRLPAALIAWALIVLGAILFALPRTLNTNLINSFLWGALYGLVVYGTYNFTNSAVFAKWPFTITCIDVAWGMIANGILLVLMRWINSYWTH